MKGLSTSGSATVSGTFANTTGSNTNKYQYTFSVASSSSNGISIGSLELRITNASGTFTTPALSAGPISIGNYTINVTGLSGGKVVAGTSIVIEANPGFNKATKGFNPLPLVVISQIAIIDTASNSVIYTS